MLAIVTAVVDAGGGNQLASPAALLGAHRPRSRSSAGWPASRNPRPRAPDRWFAASGSRVAVKTSAGG
jgi:hypothetical protein